MPERYRALVTLAAGTGLRQGECFGLTWEHVDLERRVLRVEQQLVTSNGRGTVLGPPKTAASRRQVPLPDVVVRRLAEHRDLFYVEQPAVRTPGPVSRETGDACPPVVRTTGSRVTRVTLIPGLVFTDELGRPIRRNRFGEVWRAAVARATGEAIRIDSPPMHFHDLRHFYASLLIRHGESVKVVQARLGHASAAETLDTYSHLWPDSEELTRAAVDAVLGAMASP